MRGMVVSKQFMVKYITLEATSLNYRLLMTSSFSFAARIRFFNNLCSSSSDIPWKEKKYLLAVIMANYTYV